MSAIQTHGPKILLAATLVGCGVFAWMESSGTSEVPAEFTGIDGDRERIEKALRGGPVSDKYAYSRANIDGLKFQDDATAIFERASKKVETEIPAYVAYQQPARPKVDQGSKPPEESDLTKQDFAEIKDLVDLKASGDHGRVFVTFRIPQKMRYMEPVRIEVFRGESADKIDMKSAYATIDLAPEEPAAGEEKPAVAAPEEKPEAPVAESAAARRRKERAAGEEAPKSPRADPKKAKEEKTEEIPSEFADIKVFADTHVEQKRTYYYKLRMITRMTVEPGKRIDEKDPNGILQRIVIVNAPKNAQSVKPTREGSKAALFATPLSNVVSATPPSNFEIRLAGTSGKLDPAGVAEFKRSKEYKGNFAVRVWVTEAQAWKDITIQAGPDERLKGTIHYKSADTKEAKTFDFDANYRLVEIKWGELVRETEVDEPVLDKDGNPEMDPKTRKPKMVKKIKKGDPIPNEIAVLEDLATKKLEEFPKRADFERREKSLEYYALIEKEQQKAEKAFKIRMEKVKERIRASEEERKAKQAEQEAANAAAAQQSGSPTAPLGGGNRRSAP
ncbi:MAG TPA: hypothetical protein VEK08_03000 [Planctomycetota bacterium]|nr:hypothetical protein [Planctomycetota bacterium]